MNAFRVLLLTALVVPTPALAQKASSPEKALEFYVGRWTSHGGTRNSPADPWTPVRTWETCSWVIDRHAVECRETMRISSVPKPSHGIYLLNYDSVAKHFTVYGIDDTGMKLTGVGNVESDSGKWSWTLEMEVGGQTTRWRYDFAPTSRNTRSMTLMIEEPGDKWTPMTNAVYTRAK
jgi:uncharacterized protein DUF1579